MVTRGRDRSGNQALQPAKVPLIRAVGRSATAAAHWWRGVCREHVLSLTSARRAKQVPEGFKARGFQVSQEITDALQQEARGLQRITDLVLPVIQGERGGVIAGERR